MPTPPSYTIYDPVIESLYEKLHLNPASWQLLLKELQKKEAVRLKALLHAIGEEADKLDLDWERLIHWKRIFDRDTRSPWLEEFKPEPMAAKHSEMGEKVSTTAYAIFNGLGFSLALLALLHGNLSPALGQVTGLLGAGETWSYIDIGSGYLLALHQWSKGDKKQSLITTVSTMQFQIATISALVAVYAAESITEGVGGAIIGFAFAADMFFSACIEQLEINKIQEHILHLEEKIKKSDAHPENKKYYEQLLLLEKAKLRDHIKNRNVWILCGMATLIGALVALNIATFGAPLIAMAVATGLALTSSVVRALFLGKNKNVKQLESIPQVTLNTWFTLLEQAYQTKDENLSTPLSTEKANTLLSLKPQVSTLCYESPEKAQRLIEALNRYATGKGETAGDRALIEKYEAKQSRDGEQEGEGDAEGVEVRI